MDEGRVIQILQEIRDLQRELLESHRLARQNQERAVEEQSAVVARNRKLQVGLGLAIAIVLIIVLLLLGYLLSII